MKFVPNSLQHCCYVDEYRDYSCCNYCNHLWQSTSNFSYWTRYPDS